ncbi:dNTP triphosphohydrolase [Micromonospora sp. NBC_00898]|uniref:deoxyguanosinetriphosphate triphosphohydrolase family protein n=1 Tax=Micromonospora sp. NBC_00898 TaxID=2975981 RepID=UPI0038683134|nr:dNTP triphosphohydrolase [Micromonospora sp. NBC_00898]
MGIEGYVDAWLARHNDEDPPGEASGRNDFARDRDRVLYSSAFRALHGKTQVMAAGELGYAHNRQMHSIKVAQLGRAVAGRLRDSGAGPHPDLVEAACLAHDIGHPPFGHVGEKALGLAMDAHRRKELGLSGEQEPTQPLDGFEGNAQNLRILTCLSTHRVWNTRGLHLTRGTLVATLKYPWTRELTGKQAKKWGAFEAERKTLEWILDGRPEGAIRSVEAELMDWCDDITYAVHDVEDFYRLGFIPLHRIFQFSLPAEHPQAGRDSSEELQRFLEFVAKDWSESLFGPYDETEFVKLLHELADNISVAEPYRSSRYHKGMMQTTTSDLIKYFADITAVSGPGAGYETKLEVPDERRIACELLKKLIWFYVIRRPQFAAQQFGQDRIVTNLVNWLAADPERLLPEDRAEELQEHGDVLRAVADYIVSLTESMALTLHKKLSGQDLGHVTDLI